MALLQMLRWHFSNFKSFQLILVICQRGISIICSHKMFNAIILSTEGDYVLVAREYFSSGEKLALRLRGPWRVVKALFDYIFHVIDLRNGSLNGVHAHSLRFYSDSALDKSSILPYVLSPETAMSMARLMKLQETCK